MNDDAGRVADAVQVATAARDPWAAAQLPERVDAVRSLVASLEGRRDSLVEVIQAELGQPEAFTRAVHVDGPIDGLRLLCEAAESISWSRQVGSATVERVPVGVVGALTPWNYPLHQVVAKVGAALIAGCPVVLKPSEWAPGSADVLADAATGLIPAGVLQVVHGDGASVGASLVSHEGLDAVSFTGSERVGRLVAAAAGAAGSRVTVELGGKSAGVILDDVDDRTFTRAVRLCVAEAVANAGQTCSALTRLLVPRDRHDEALAIAAQSASRYVAGDRLGPLISPAAVDRVSALVNDAVARGARLVVGGHRPALQQTDGAFAGRWFEATVLADVDADDPIARDEIFGPVLVVLPHGGDGDAAAIAASTGHGLSIAVWSGDEARAEAFGRTQHVGQVRIGGSPWDSRLPFGGFGRSGFGREWGNEGIEAFTTTRVIARG